MEKKVIISEDVREKLIDLIDILIENDYFSFKENAHNYVEEIIAFIYSIPELRRKPTKHNRFGNYYCKFKPNRKTTWFATFDIQDDVFLIKNIINNHTSDYNRFIKGIS